MVTQELNTGSLISRLKESLPFHAFVTKHAFAAYSSTVRPPVRNKQRIEITDVLDGGNEGGIVCVAAINGGKEGLAISITHLRLEMCHPLYKKVRAYQIDRTKRLAIARMASMDQQSKNRLTGDMSQ